MGASGVTQPRQSGPNPQTTAMVSLHGPALAAVSSEMAGESPALETAPPLTGRAAVAEMGGLPESRQIRKSALPSPAPEPEPANPKTRAVSGFQPHSQLFEGRDFPGPSDTAGSQQVQSEIQASSTTSARTVILPRDSTPGPAPDVGGGSVGSAATALDGDRQLFSARALVRFVGTVASSRCSQTAAMRAIGKV